MFGIGPTELLVIVALALMLFPPRELPKLIRSVAKAWGSVRATADEFREAIMTADGVDELQQMVKGTKEEVRRAEASARRELMKARADMRRAQQKLVQTTRATEEIRRREQAHDGPASGEGQPVPTRDPTQPTPAQAEGPAAAEPPTTSTPSTSAPSTSAPSAPSPGAPSPGAPSPGAPSPGAPSRGVEEGAA